jgi:hypothetical protein
MINNFYIEDFYAFSSYVAGACTYGSDDNIYGTQCKWNDLKPRD